MNNYLLRFLITFSLIIIRYTSIDVNGQNKFLITASPTPEEVGERLVTRFIQGKFFLHQNRWIHYPEVCTWIGGLQFADKIRDTTLLNKLESRFLPVMSSKSDLLPPKNHVDMSMFGSLPLTLYQITKDEKYLFLGLPYADIQWMLPPDATAFERSWHQKGLSWQSRLWIDDLYMITILQVMAYKATDNPKYIDRAANEMVYYLKELQQTNGLFYHASDVPFFWGRGNGWVAVAMAELLKAMPCQHPVQSNILLHYKKMMKSLVEFQNDKGMWNQLVDDPDSWAETSGSAMFAYSLAVGVNNGWLTDKISRKAVEKAWNSLITYLDDNNDMTEVCIGTNKKNDRQYYYDRPRIVGDLHGQAPMLWLATELVNNYRSN